MKYTSQIVINKPRAEVIEAFKDPEGPYEWQPTLLRLEPVSGEVLEPGAVTNMVFQQGKGEFTMSETVESQNLPDAVTFIYKAGPVWNRMENRFIAADENTTRWEADNEFRFSGFMAIMSLFMRGSFPKETEKSMRAFKTYAESRG